MADQARLWDRRLQSIERLAEADHKEATRSH
jgi:hypothetical protein